MSYLEKLKVWVSHIGGSFKEVSDTITEFYIPETNLVVHVDQDKNELYVHGFNGRSQVETDTFRIRTSGLDEGDPVDDKRTISNPNFAMVTLDDIVGSIEIQESPKPYYQNKDMLKIGISIINNSESMVSYSWSDMTPEERGEQLKNIPDTHHKEILIEELESSGLDFIIK